MSGIKRIVRKSKYLVKGSLSVVKRQTREERHGHGQVALRVSEMNRSGGRKGSVERSWLSSKRK